ncbi:MAG: energy-coupling factor ABC transporter permease [Methanosphaera sp.]|nr:energy-coupling factor ABC transporter permease [Methanosphaera sp.]
MHIPDGLIGKSDIASTLINPEYQLIIYAIISIILLILVFNKFRKNHTEKDIPKVALFVVACVIVQMIEIPLPVPACVHISLITILALYDLDLSMIVYAFVTIIQAFLGEGGVSTMGINVLNLAILAPLIAYYVYNILKSYNKNIALFLSGFATITLLGVIVSIEYALAGVYPLTFGLTVITPIEAVVGVLEGIVTVFVMNALLKIKPELVPELAESNGE